jgi:hypothetical protein
LDLQLDFELLGCITVPMTAWPGAETILPHMWSRILCEHAEYLERRLQFWLSAIQVSVECLTLTEGADASWSEATDRLLHAGFRYRQYCIATRRFRSVSQEFRDQLQCTPPIEHKSGFARLLKSGAAYRLNTNPVWQVTRRTMTARTNGLGELARHMCKITRTAVFLPSSAPLAVSPAPIMTMRTAEADGSWTIRRSFHPMNPYAMPVPFSESVHAHAGGQLGEPFSESVLDSSEEVTLHALPIEDQEETLWDSAVGDPDYRFLWTAAVELEHLSNQQL